MAYRDTVEQRNSDHSSRRDIPSFIEPRPPLISNPFMRPRPEKGVNLLELFDEDSEIEEPELVQVYLRLKPCVVPNNLYEIRSNKCLITSVDTATAGHGRRTQHNVSKVYTFSHIFGPKASQKEIFENVVKDNLKKLPEGHSFTLLTYGASGSGKTYTLMGTVTSPGLVPRSLEYIFKIVEAAQTPLYKPADGGTETLGNTEQQYELQFLQKLRQVSAPLRDKYRRMSVQLYNDFKTSFSDLSNKTKYYVWVSFVEIYNEAVYDLLDTSDRRLTSKLRIREDTNGNVYVKGATHAFVRSGQEAYDVMAAGKHNLQVAATGVHAHSSRSHCIFTITMLTETDSSVRTSHVRLCDLAGCERAQRTRNTGARMAESRAINASLHVLERCLHTLRRKQRQGVDHALVPYRESKLTRLLGAGLSGVRGEAVSMVVTLNPAAECAHETRHVLQLATVARDIQVNSTIEPEITFGSGTQETTYMNSSISHFEVMRLRTENERMHFELKQAEARVNELEEKQRSTADTMQELVEETKDYTEQYYKDRIRVIENRHLSDIHDLKASFEKQVSQLMAERNTLEDELNSERLARERLEEVIQHLHVCINERDEKGSTENIPENDIVSLTDSEGESDVESDDPCNESLEPTFRQENINRSRLITQSFSCNTSDNNNDFEGSKNDDISNNVTDIFADTAKDGDITVKDSTYLTGEDAGNLVHKTESTFDMTNDIEEHIFNIDITNKSSKSLVNASKINSSTRETFHVNYIETHDSSKHTDDVNKSSELHLRGTFCIGESDDSSPNNNTTEVEKIEFKKPFDTFPKDITEMVSKTSIKKIEKVAKITPGRESSLSQFERLEIAAKTCNNPSKRETDLFANIRILQEKRNYFDDNNDSTYLSHVNSNENLHENITDVNTYTKPLTHDDSSNDFENIKTLKENNRTYLDNIDINIDNGIKKATELTNILHLKCDNVISLTSMKDDFAEIPSINKIETSSVDLFEDSDSPSCKTVEKYDKKEDIVKSIKKLHLNEKDDLRVLETDIETKINYPSTLNEALQLENPLVSNNNETNTCLKINNSNQNNSVEEFDNLYKDITSRETEFELLVSQGVDDFEVIKDDKKEEQYEQETIKNKIHKNDQNKIESENEDATIPGVKYNLRKKPLCVSAAKATESNVRMKRNLRLRRLKNMDNEEFDKLKDIKNLQQEFSDVTSDVPAPKNESKDIPSPEKKQCDENLSPLSVQSCPSKCATRNRRKLFTPLVEPLEEPLNQGGDSSEPIYIPRPSYHRTKARRKLDVANLK